MSSLTIKILPHNKEAVESPFQFTASSLQPPNNTYKTPGSLRKNSLKEITEIWSIPLKYKCSHGTAQPKTLLRRKSDRPPWLWQPQPAFPASTHILVPTSGNFIVFSAWKVSFPMTGRINSYPSFQGSAQVTPLAWAQGPSPLWEFLVKHPGNLWWWDHLQHKHHCLRRNVQRNEERRKRRGTFLMKTRQD